MFKKLTSIEVGAHEDKVGYTATYQNGEREHHLFAPSVALQLCEHLSKLARAAQIKVADDNVTVGMAKPQTPQTERRSGYVEQVGISDSVNVGLSTAVEEGENHENGSKKIH
jgi:hypothetical protein